MTLNYHYRIGNIEARSCDVHLTTWRPATTIELVQWAEGEKPHCWAIAWFIREKEGYKMVFCGDRPFDLAINRMDFMTIAESAQRVLDRFCEEDTH